MKTTNDYMRRRRGQPLKRGNAERNKSARQGRNKPDRMGVRPLPTKGGKQSGAQKTKETKPRTTRTDRNEKKDRHAEEGRPKKKSRRHEKEGGEKETHKRD